MELQAFKDRLLSLAYDKVTSVYEIEKFIYNFYKTKPLIISAYNPEFLARCSKNEEGEIFLHVNRCSYKPTPVGIPLQRCNYENQQVFYASAPVNSEFTNVVTSATLEVLFQSIRTTDIDNVEMTISRWKLNRPLNLFIFPFSSFVIDRNPQLYKTSLDIESYIRSCFDITYKEAVDYFIDSLKFMSECLSTLDDKEAMYKITAAFYNAVMKIKYLNNIICDGMLYPASNSESAGINIVLKKEVIDENALEVDYVIMQNMKRSLHDKKDITFDTCSRGVIPNENGFFQLKNYWGRF